MVSFLVHGMHSMKKTVNPYTLTISEVTPAQWVDLIALFERAVGLYASSRRNKCLPPTRCRSW